MKTSKILLVITGFAAGYTLLAADPPVGAPTNVPPALGLPAAPTNAPAGAVTDATGTNAPAAATVGTNAPGAEDLTTNGLPKVSVENGAEGLRFNFRGAPLKLVLEHLVKAAGFIVDNQTSDLRGTVEIWTQGPVTKDEAIELVGSALRKNGYAFSRHDRILQIRGMDGINQTDLPLHTGNKWEDIPQTDDVVIWILPVKYANASQLIQNLQLLVPTTTTLSVNESANSIIMVGTQRDIRRMARLVSALDSSISGVTSIKVFQLHYADAKQLATEIQTLFGSQASGQGGGGGGARQFFNMFGGGRGGGGGGFPFGGGGNQAASGGGAAAGSKVSATSDDYSNSLIVSASEEMMKTIDDMVKEIDVPTTDVTELRVFRLVHADPNEIAEQLSELFPDTSRTSQNNNGGGFSPFRFMQGGGGGGRSATTTDRQKQKTQVMAVPDPRTGSLLVSAASELMPHIADMIEKLDEIDARHEVVHVFDLRNADPQDVNQALADLFNRTTKMNSSANSGKSLLGTGNPLTTRATQNNTSSGSSGGMSTGFGSSRGGGGSSF